MLTHPRWRETREVLLLAGVIALIFARGGLVREMLAVAELSRPDVRSEEDFERTLPVLGPEYPVLRRLRDDYPPGTSVSVQARGRFVARGQRFWLVLLPTYPVDGGSGLVICPASYATPHDDVLERGHEFVLLRRGGGSPRP